MTQAKVPTEAQEGFVLVAWLRVKQIPFTHIPNETGGSMEARRRAIRMKQQGTSKGFPDYVVFTPKGTVFIELKRLKGSKISDEQKSWIETINKTPGAEAWICAGAEAAIGIIERYL